MTVATQDAEGQYIKCNLCGGQDFNVLFPAGVAQREQIVRCKKCGLMQANPRQGPTDLEEVVERWPGYKMKEQPWFPMRRDKEQLQVADCQDTRSELGVAYPHRGMVLEVGSSFGYGLASWRSDGWQVVGVEPWAEAAQYAKEELGIQTFADQLRNVNFPSEQFDVVVMLHVIEHLADPVAELKEVFRVLKPGGRFVCETPRYDSLMFTLLGRRERSLLCDGHIYFFEVPTLIAVGDKAGFIPEKTKLVGRTLTLERLLWNVGRVSKSVAVQGAMNWLSSRLGLGKLTFYFNVRDMQRITFRKPEAKDLATSA